MAISTAPKTGESGGEHSRLARPHGFGRRAGRKEDEMNWLFIACIAGVIALAAMVGLANRDGHGGRHGSRNAPA